MAQETLRLTTEQRLVALERQNVMLRDKMKTLHGMLKQQRQLVNEYITQRVLLADGDGGAVPYDQSTEALGSFLCQRRFEQVEERIDRLGASVGEGTARRRAM